MEGVYLWSNRKRFCRFKHKCLSIKLYWPCLHRSVHQVATIFRQYPQRRDEQLCEMKPINKRHYSAKGIIIQYKYQGMRCEPEETEYVCVCVCQGMRVKTKGGWEPERPSLSKQTNTDSQSFLIPAISPDTQSLMNNPVATPRKRKL